MKRLVLALVLLAGCAGQYPIASAAARRDYCVQEGCPAEAHNFGGFSVHEESTVDGCECVIQDLSNRLIVVKVPYVRW